MKYFILKQQSILIFLINILKIINADESCSLDSTIYMNNGSYIVSKNNDPNVCKQSLIVSSLNTNVILVMLNDIKIDCNAGNLKISDLNKNMYDYCQAKKNGGALNYYASSNSHYVTLSTTGTLSFSFFLIIMNSPDNIFTTKPASTLSTASKTTQMPQTTPADVKTTTTAATIAITTTATTTDATTTEATTKIDTTTVSGHKCGIPAIKPIDTSNFKIVGGIEAKVHSWPWQVLITDYEIICGASVIDTNWILSAAHCKMPDGKVRALFGDHNIDEDHDTNEITRKVVKQIIHPKYSETKNPFEWDYDIMLLKLASPITYSDIISPICLPNGRKPKIGQSATVTGWGDTKNPEDDEKDNVLKQTTVKITENSVCEKNSTTHDLSDRQICAGQLTPKIHDSCQGDSGGPFVIKDGEAFYQAGVVSSSFDDCEGHGIYTNIVYFEDWIKETMAAN